MKRSTLFAIIIALVFGVVFAAQGLLAPQIWNSPDETAVAFFAKSVAKTGLMWVEEPANLFGPDLVHPRSIVSLDAFLKPGSFYGAIYYFGGLFKVLGPIALAVGTPFLTAIASLLVFLILRRWGDERRAIIAQILFLANPAVWYFASRGLFPNLLFLDFVICGLSVLYLRPWAVFAKGRGNAVLATLIDDLIGLGLLGAAVIIRPVELIWLGPIALVLLWLGRRSLKWWRIVFGLIILGLFVGTLLMTNKGLYGSLWSFGYTAGSTAPGVSVPALSQGSRLPAAISAPRPFILPFGLHPHAALVNLWNYLVLFAWWLPALAALGLLLTKNRIERRRWSRVFLWTAAALGLYYGSGVFTDSSVSQWTIGSSYLRYFLPATILLVPLAAEGVYLMSAKRKWVSPVVIGVFLVLSAWTVGFRTPEALIPMHAELDHYAEVKAAVLKETTSHDIIITERSDKIFFPDRKVMIGLRDQNVLNDLPRLAAAVGVYYYGITISEEELPQINAELHKRKLQLGRVKTFGNETLYSITRENRR